MSRKWLRHGYSKVVRIFGKLDSKKQNFPVLEGHPAAQEHAEVAVETHGTIRNRISNVLKEFRIYSWNPDHPNSKPLLQSFYIDFSNCGPMVLDALQKIKAEDDSSLSYRRSCREGICGSCAMNIDGTNTVACLKPIDANTSAPTIITPLPRMFVIKDLVVDLTNFLSTIQVINNIVLNLQDLVCCFSSEFVSMLSRPRLIEPWLKTTKAPEDGREYRQSPADRKKLDGLYECILCACCSTSCPSYWWNPEEFTGPAALLLAYRWICDGRDEFTEARLQSTSEDHKNLYRCRTIKNCRATRA